MSSSSTKHRRKRPNEKNLPTLSIPESQLYQKLQSKEKQLDTLLIRKRLDIQEAVSRPIKTKKYLRVFVSNSAAFQDYQIQQDFSQSLEESVPSWTLCIQGKLLDNNTLGKKFTSFFKRIVIELQRDSMLYPEGSNIIEWTKSSTFVDSDGFEVKRRGDQKVDCRIMFYLDNVPEKYKLSNELSSILNLHTESKPIIILTVWQYIKANKLQDLNDHRIINCDDNLRNVFQVNQFQFTQLADLIMPHLAPADPIVFDYTIQVDKPYSSSPYYLDIEVEMDDPIRSQLLRFITNTSTAKEIATIDQQIVKNVSLVHLHKLKRNFLLSFAKNPVDFINRWVASQARDQEIIIGDHHVNKEWERRSDFYKEPWVPEAIFSYLSQFQNYE